MNRNSLIGQYKQIKLVVKSRMGGASVRAEQFFHIAIIFLPFAAEC